MNDFFATIPPHILDKSVNIDLDIHSQNCLDAVSESLNKTVLSGGKRLRPLLTYLVADLFDADMEKVNTCAKAIEMVHAASLAHDDVIDMATMRRGNPSINIETSNKRAVLAGDFLLADVILSLSTLNDITILQTMSQVIQELSNGEWIQSDALDNREYSKEIITKIAFHKTASVMGWCCWAGAYLSKFELSTQKRLELASRAQKFGHNLGIAFQMMDDTLDFSSSEDSLKDALLDLEQNLVNSVVFDYLTKSNRMTDYVDGKNLVDIVDLENINPSVEAIKSESAVLIDEANSILENVAKELPSDSKVINEKLVPLLGLGQFILKRNS